MTTVRALVRVLVLALSAALLLLPGRDAAAASLVLTAPDVPWQTTGNPYVWSMGDSVLGACLVDPASGGVGLGWRDLGHLAWPGATASMLRDREQGLGTWPPETVTVPGGNRAEQLWFRDAGALLVDVGTDDAKSEYGISLFPAEVDWFLQQARGRPVVWVNAHNPPFEAGVRRVDADLAAAALRWPNLKVVDWDAFASSHPQDVRGDLVHPADDVACGHYAALIAAAMAAVPGGDAPHGYWYGSTRTPVGVRVSGWASAWLDPRRELADLNIRVGGRHLSRRPVGSASAGGDPYAGAASGRAFSVVLPLSVAGQVVCLDLVDRVGAWTSLGCRTA